MEKEIRVHTADGEMTAFVVCPDEAKPLPVAILFQDGVGYREQVKANARRFAAAGYFSAAPDMFYRAGEGISFDFARMITGAEEERERMMKIVRTVTPDRAVADTKALLAVIASDPAASKGPKVCVGYCMGARIALRVAAAIPDQFVAAAGIHPGALIGDGSDSPHHDLAGVRGELYFAFAEIDRSATPELVDRFREEMRVRGVRGEVERIAGVAHGFAMADLPVYNQDASERHFEKTLELWRRNLSHEAVTTSR